MRYGPVVALLFLSTPAFSDVVVPLDTVENYIMIRSEPKGGTDPVGKLHQGGHLEYVKTVPRWYEIRMEDGTTGYVSQTWTKVVAEPVTVADEPSPAETAGSDEEVSEAPEAVAESAEEATPPAEKPAEPEEPVEPEAPAVATPAEPAPPAEPETPVVEAEPAPQPAKPVTPVEPAPPEPTPEPVFVDLRKPKPAPEPDDDADDERVSAKGGRMADVKGKSNYIAKFTASRKVRRSQIFDDGSNVGIGTKEPQNRLEVNGNIHIHETNKRVAALLLTPASGQTGFIMHNVAGVITIGSGAEERITVDGDGRVGIGVSSPEHPLELANGAHVTAGGVWTNRSTVEAKENISNLTLEEAVDALDGLTPVHYNYKVDRSENYVGFIAEDVPDLVATGDRTGLSSMDIVAVLTRVVQDQQRRIEELEARLDAE